MSEQPISSHSSLALDSHSRFRVVDGEGIVILQRAAEVVVTNATGARILELIKDGKSVGEVASALTEEFEVDPQTALEDTQSFAAELLSLGAITTA